MEVTKSNFSELLPKIKQSIDESDFIGVDTELTGLYSSRSEEHAFDTMEDRYMKIREQCSKFLIIQFGLSTFKYHPEEKKYTHVDFNFYVFPRPHSRQAPDPRFICQTSSVHFLASHGFDFNKVIYEGIPYLTFAQESKIRDHVTRRYKTERSSIKQTPKANGQKTVEIPAEHKNFIADINKRVDAFIADESQTVMQLEPCSAFLRKLIYETVQQKHKTGLEMSSKVTENTNQRYITILKCSDQDKLNKIDEQEINDLPFLESTGLSEIFRLVKGKSFELPAIEIEEGFKGYNLNSEKYHEAGYDAFLAGLCYIAMTQKLGTLLTPKVEHLETSSKALSRYVNRFFIRQHFDIVCLNLNGPDPEPDRSNVFYVSFPEDWKTVDLVELFLPYGNIYVHWLDDVSALVALKSPGNALAVRTSLLNKSNRIYRVKLYSEYQKWTMQQLQSNKKEENKKSYPSDSKPSVSKRKNSGSGEGSSVCNMDLIPEDDENEAETVDCSELHPTKKRKAVEEENETGEVSSTARVFEEENTW
ncbi:poly(A)-specific ribonuclease PARN [Nephila pilipes]|uniref:Poly(A)-specific ribonuclease PARN n=1 Tax=Nephila pilipes TaxID=299642 RepID=A0A8X6UFF4_NEPPI|nr:poly(A)-specific ribonuclease PARN [Nephila pilipes]